MRDNDRFEDIVGKDLDVRASDGTYDRLREVVLNAHGPSRAWKSAATLIPKRRIIMRISTIRTLAAALIGIGVVTAATVGVKYHFVRKDPERGYLVRSEDGRSMMNLGASHTASPEQAVETAEEITRLKKQGLRELVAVGETEVNGQLDSRMLTYEYRLSDGRTLRVGERDPEDNAPWSLVGERHEEASRLFRETVAGCQFAGTDEGKLRVLADGSEIPTFERVIQGRTFFFDKYTFTLSDGTQVARSLGRLSNDGPAITRGLLSNDLREIASLRRQDKRQLIAVDELTANGAMDRRVFVYRYQLSDGRTKDVRETPKGVVPTPILSVAQRQEWAKAREAGAGQDLDAYDEEVLGLTFAFKRQRFILTDGTELIWSYGKLKDTQ